MIQPELTSNGGTIRGDMVEKDAPLFEEFQHTSNFRLPTTYCREIGRLIVRWAFFEHQVQSIIWAIAFKSDPLGGALGRLSTVEKRFPERFELLSKLAKVWGLQFDEPIFNAIKTTSAKLDGERNLLAHGTWAKHPKLGWLVRETRGEWKSNAGGPNGPKKVTPQSTSRKPPQIARTVFAVETLIEKTRALQNSIHY